MTDQGPTQPGYRARAEAAEAEVERLQHDIDVLTHENATEGVLNYIAEKQASESEATRYIHELQAKLHAAEARVAELEAERDEWKQAAIWEKAQRPTDFDHIFIVRERDELLARLENRERERLEESRRFVEVRDRVTAAEAREQALRDRVTELADEIEAASPEPFAPFHFFYGSKLRALVHPPNTDTDDGDSA